MNEYYLQNIYIQNYEILNISISEQRSLNLKVTYIRAEKW